MINAALFPRELFDRVRFDPRLKYGLDEVDLTTQAVACGYRIVPCFEASNSHFPSDLGREGYGEAAIAARLYVTLKRRRFTEGSRLRGWTGFGLAAAHAYLAACKRYGPRAGTRLGNRTLKAAWSYYEKYKRGQGLSGGEGSAESKIAALRAAGITVAESPATIGDAVAKVLGVASAAA